MKQSIVSKIEDALKSLQVEGILPAFSVSQVDFRVEPPKDEQFGDYTSNVALVLAKEVAKNPRELAILIQSKIQHQFAKVEVAIFYHK